MAALVSGSSCERGSGWRWLHEHGVGEAPPPTMPGSLPIYVVDCPDGLARCMQGNVEASQLAVIPQPCHGPEGHCTCPWVRVAWCDIGCVVDGVEVVVDSARAGTQLCAIRPDAGPPVAIPSVSAVPGSCEDGQLYRCAGGAIADCASHAIVGRCVRGCLSEGASIDDGTPVVREAAFAILCSR
jgi:hypothetical protein